MSLCDRANGAVDRGRDELVVTIDISQEGKTAHSDNFIIPGTGRVIGPGGGIIKGNLITP